MSQKNTNIIKIIVRRYISVNMFNNTSKTVDNPLETSSARCSLKTMRYAPTHTAWQAKKSTIKKLRKSMSLPYTN